jgi:DNA-binding FadR family transcriptional regulator
MPEARAAENDSHSQSYDKREKGLRRERLSDRVADRIQDDIISMGLKAGDRLMTEQELVERFDVSRSVIREAGRTLDARGLVIIRPGTGMVVAEFDGSTLSLQYELLLELDQGRFEDLLALRLVLEVGMTELAAKHRTEDDVAAIKALLAEFDSARGDVQTFLDWDLKFDEAIASASKNPFFGHITKTITRSLRKTYTYSAEYLNTLRETMDEHSQIANAVFDSDVVAAGNAARNHLNRIASERHDRSEETG